MIERKVEEETKPKFNVGDRIVTDTNMKGKVTEVVEKGWYRVEFEPHNGIPQPNGVVPEESMSLMEEEKDDCSKCGLTPNSVRCLFMDNCPHNKQKNIIEIPEGYVLKDENGKEILTSKIILEKKKKEYPKTIEECCKILGLEFDPFYTGVKRQINYKDGLLHNLKCLLIYRDAYWKLAGEEMGLGKPWEPDWANLDQLKYCIWVDFGEFTTTVNVRGQRILAFPTEEMRDAFKKNFDPDIEICKELL